MVKLHFCYYISEIIARTRLSHKLSDNLMCGRLRKIRTYNLIKIIICQQYGSIYRYRTEDI